MHEIPQEMIKEQGQLNGPVDFLARHPLSLAEVAVDYPGPGPLSYEIPNELIPILKEGDLVEIPLGRREALGVVLKTYKGDSPEGIKLKKIASITRTDFALSPLEIQLYKWMEKYYHYPLGQLIFDILPRPLKRPRPARWAQGQGVPLGFDLTDEQQAILDHLLPRLVKTWNQEEEWGQYYIHGATGTGKSIIYLEVIKEALRHQRSALFLLPEINLTPQFIDFFQKHLKGPILVYHSGLSASDRDHVWMHLKNSKDPIFVMGVRSSIFLPLPNLGTIIIDEEHDPSFKQSDRCPYHARDIAIKKAQLSHATVIMGSATPTVENYYSFKLNSNNKNKTDNKTYYQLTTRALGHFPKIELIDERPLKKNTQNRTEQSLHWPLEERSIELIQEALDKKEQVLIYVNRLGHAQYLQCRSCGHKFTDPNSDVPLRYFKQKKILASTHSDYKIPLPEWCPSCGNLQLLPKGYGTEKVQEVLKAIFKDKVIERFDRDEITTLRDLEEKLKRFLAGDIDILVGTQMLSKGHNFPRVNLVIALGIDSQLNFPDFRSLERTFQQLIQVAGRAGRFSPSAIVAIQTLNPENPLFTQLENPLAFYEEELKIRHDLELSPFSRIAIITLTAKTRERAISASESIAQELIKRINSDTQKTVKLLGPAPALMEKRMNMYSWNIVLRSTKINPLHSLLILAQHLSKNIKTATLKIDVDPLATL